MFKIESYVTPILLSYVDKYVKDFRPADAQVSLWGGGVVLHNLVLKTDVLEQLPIPFSLVSGRIHELLIQVPWTKIMSEPIIVTIDTIECILNLRSFTNDSATLENYGQSKAQVVEAPPGYMQALVRRIVSNIAIKVHHLIVKYVQDDIVLSLNIKHLSIDSVGVNWEPAFADIDQIKPIIRRLVFLDDLTLCLDSSDSDGKIRFYQDPVLYRCQLELRVLTNLVSANARRASDFKFQLRSSKLAWGVTSDQLLLLQRLIKERAPSPPIIPAPKSSPSQKSGLKLSQSKTSNTGEAAKPASKNQLNKDQSASNIVEPARRESWADWAWSWMPTWADREPGAKEMPMPAQPTPVFLAAYLDDISLAVKMMETEGETRKRARSILELSASHAAIKGSICAPTKTRIRIGLRRFLLKSTGKCSCGHTDINAAFDEPTIYLSNRQNESDEEWKWPQNYLEDSKEDNTLDSEQKDSLDSKKKDSSDSKKKDSPDSKKKDSPDSDDAKKTEKQEPSTSENKEKSPEGQRTTTAPAEESQDNAEKVLRMRASMISGMQKSPESEFFDLAMTDQQDSEMDANEIEFWSKMTPIIFIDFFHERSPPSFTTNPYDNPPRDFEYSDWQEESDVHIQIKPLDVSLCVGLIHRMMYLQNIFSDLTPAPTEPMRRLTIEEIEALSNNLPQRRFNVKILDLRVRLSAWDHSLTERPIKTPLTLDVVLPLGNIVVIMPLYVQRVCSAAAQLPEDTGPLWRGARVHTTVAFNNLQTYICSTIEEQSKPFGRLNMRFVIHNLLYQEYYIKKQSVLLSYVVKIREANISGSAARLHAAFQVLLSLVKEKISLSLRQSTLPKDALNDEDLVALDITAEDANIRGYLTKTVTTHIVLLQSLRATVIQSPLDSGAAKQAWLFSGPDIPTTTPFIRLAVQWCSEEFPGSLDYLGVWSEPVAFCIDPLFIAWLSYRPCLKPISDLNSQELLTRTSSVQFFRRQVSSPSSSGRTPGRTGSSTEQVHGKGRSVDSSSEKSEKKEQQAPAQVVKPPLPWWQGEALLKIHDRLRKIIISVELGLILVYVTTKTVSAVDCETARTAIEQHATNYQEVIVFSAGRWSVATSTLKKPLWHVIQQEGPTYVENIHDPKQWEALNSFPWRMIVADMSCYGLEPTSDILDRTDKTSGLRSHLKVTTPVQPQTLLELVTTTITLSVVTKSLQQKVVVQKAEATKHSELKKEDKKIKYFKAGGEFKPTTLKDFLRGPAGRQKEPEQTLHPPPADPGLMKGPVVKVTSGPMVSLGFNLHADTPPIVMRLENDQIDLVGSALHCIAHLVYLFKRNPMTVTRQPASLGLVGSVKSIRSITEMNDDVISLTESTHSKESKSNFMMIFEARPAGEQEAFKTFLLFQWVISRAALVVTFEEIKVSINIDDIITSFDVQPHYNQLKFKIASMSVKHFTREEDQWVVGPMDGRVLETREPINADEDSHFLAVTITQALIANLPSSWKEELHPKLLEQKTDRDTMWEIYALLAPLEVVIVPNVLKEIMSSEHIVSQRALCDLPNVEDKNVAVDLPFCYVSSGGVRVLMSTEIPDEGDDTLILSVNRCSVNPHPANPICRRAVTKNDSSWSTMPGSLEGTQYEIHLKKVSITSARFSKLSTEDVAEKKIIIGGENPARKWSQLTNAPEITKILHPLDINMLLAPALYVNKVLSAAPAIELNLSSDCDVEISIHQLNLALILARKLSQSVHSQLSKDDLGNLCPYSHLVTTRRSTVDLRSPNFETFNKRTLREETYTRTSKVQLDSGVDTATTRSTFKSSQYLETSAKKTSVSFMEETLEVQDHLEAFITMGMIEITLYTLDDGSLEVAALKPPKYPDEPTKLHSEPVSSKVIVDDLKKGKEKPQASTTSLKETVRTTNLRKTLTNVQESPNLGILNEKQVSLLHMTLHQPNLYYWQKKTQSNMQVSLFNIWIGLGAGLIPGYWHAEILTTARGSSDPVTEIPPAVFTMKYTNGNDMGTPSASTRGALDIDIERPILVEITTDSLKRLLGIHQLVKRKILLPSGSEFEPPSPALYTLQVFMDLHSIDVANIQMTQIGFTGTEGTAGWDSASFQLVLKKRPEKLIVRGLVNAFVVSGATQHGLRHPILQPLNLGIKLFAYWEAWKRTEGVNLAKEPTIRINFDLDRAVIELTPTNLKLVHNILHTIKELKIKKDEAVLATVISKENLYQTYDPNMDPISGTRTSTSTGRSSASSMGDHYYKDDLRSGAFKLVRGSQLPMAYQVTLYKNVVSWRYPHPRAITRLVVFPLPDQNEEIDCILEFYNQVMAQWEPYSHVKLPVSEPREIIIHVQAPEITFAVIWRFRVVCDQEKKQSYSFNLNKFLPKADPWADDEPEPIDSCGPSEVTAEHLSGILRVDSYFAPYLIPRIKAYVRLVALESYLHNSLPPSYSQVRSLDGYYVSNSLMRTHRVLGITGHQTLVKGVFSPFGGTLVLLRTQLSSEIIDCTTGTMETLADNFCIQGGLSLPEHDINLARLRVCSSTARVAVHIPRLRTLQVLAKDWQNAYNQYLRTEETEEPIVDTKTSNELAADALDSLEGLVSLWINNSTSSSLRVGQIDTDEVVIIGPGVKYAYRWYNAATVKKLRFAHVKQTTGWKWSNSIPFSVGPHRVCLEDPEFSGIAYGSQPGSGEYLHATVKQTHAHRCMDVSGKIRLANMLRHDLFYKVRARDHENSAWRTLSSGELVGEALLGTSVICENSSEMVLKIRFHNFETGWSGDIPLKECPKENVPWLVKVPSEGDMPYVSVWCRVVKARSDCRILATMWPLYVLHSTLSLDTDVLIVSDAHLAQTTELPGTQTPPLILPAPGRGTTTHLLVPGTTSARHSLSFQYRTIESPVTRDAVPLHYGVTDTSVFDKRSPVISIEEVLEEIAAWLQRSGRKAVSAWPYSIVVNHWPAKWQPALLQPRCEVAVRYQAVRAGGGCSLQVSLGPIVLLCNASTVPLTVRAHDAAPLCKLDPGTALSPPSIILTKPFFISIEQGRETFVSNQIEVYTKDPGRYGSPPNGQIALEHPTTIAIQCGNEVAIFSVLFEIKEEINVLGITSPYIVMNYLDTSLLMYTVAVPKSTNGDKNVRLLPKNFKMLEAGNVQPAPLCQFGLFTRWRGEDVSELQTYMCVALPVSSMSAKTRPVPVYLGKPPYRKPITLYDACKKARPVVVTQHKYEGRWVVTISKDPCPQFVIQNYTKDAIYIGQAKPSDENGSFSHLHKVFPECPGVKWFCVVLPSDVTYYTGPEHALCHVPSSNTSPLATLLSFALFSIDEPPIWCPPVAMENGEQLVQLNASLTIKIRVQSHPHSTLVQLRDVAVIDISASDIRKRLSEPAASIMRQRLEADISHDKSVESERSGVKDIMLSRSIATQVCTRTFDEDKRQEKIESLEKDLQNMIRAQNQLLTRTSLSEPTSAKISEMDEKRNIDNNEKKDVSDEKNKPLQPTENKVEGSVDGDKPIKEEEASSSTKNKLEINIVKDHKHKKADISDKKNTLEEEKKPYLKIDAKTALEPKNISEPPKIEADKSGEKKLLKKAENPNLKIDTKTELEPKNISEPPKKVADKSGEKNPIKEAENPNLKIEADKSGEKKLSKKAENLNLKIDTKTELEPKNISEPPNIDVDKSDKENTLKKEETPNLKKDTKTALEPKNISEPPKKVADKSGEKNPIKEAENPNLKIDTKTAFEPKNISEPPKLEADKSDEKNTLKKEENPIFKKDTETALEPETISEPPKIEADKSEEKNTLKKEENPNLKIDTKTALQPKNISEPPKIEADKSDEKNKSTKEQNQNFNMDNKTSSTSKNISEPSKVETDTSDEKTRSTNEKSKNVSEPSKVDSPIKIEKLTDNDNATNIEYELKHRVSIKIEENDIQELASKFQRDDSNSTIDQFIQPEYNISDDSSFTFQHEDSFKDWKSGCTDKVRCMIAGIVVEMSATNDTKPLLAVHVDHAILLLAAVNKKKKMALSITDIQVDNLQYENGQFDFAVIATTCAEPAEELEWPIIWTMFADNRIFNLQQEDARCLVKVCQEKWTVIGDTFSELTEVEFRAGPLALYIEDAYVKAMVDLLELVGPHKKKEEPTLHSEVQALRKPLRLQMLIIHPLNLTLTLHTAVRMYIALDQSPLYLDAFKVQNMMTSTESLVHALTVHYLSAAILGAGWVVGGLELLGAPGALAARVGGASGGVRGVATAAAAALLKSLSACAGSLARNLDLLAGDEEHARRAAAARRRPPDSFVGGILLGITNFAINILGAVGGLAHHPLVGVAVGEGSSAAALRRSLVGAVTKPLSATADLVAYAGHGLLKQTGWDPVPQPRTLKALNDKAEAGWRQQCVRLMFRLAELDIITGFEVLLNSLPVQLLLSHKYLVIVEAYSENVLEMIEFRYCSMGPYEGGLIELVVSQNQESKIPEKPNLDEVAQVSVVAMARVARYTGAESSEVGEARVLTLVPAGGQSFALHAVLAVLIHSNSRTHFSFL